MKTTKKQHESFHIAWDPYRAQRALFNMRNPRPMDPAFDKPINQLKQ